MRMARTAADSYKAEPTAKQFVRNVHVLQKPQRFYFSRCSFARRWPYALIAKGPYFVYVKRFELKHFIKRCFPLNLNSIGYITVCEE